MCFLVRSRWRSAHPAATWRGVQLSPAGAGELGGVDGSVEGRAESRDAQGMREEHALWLKNSYDRLCSRERSKGTPQISPFREPPPQAGLPKPTQDCTAPFQKRKALPLCPVLGTRAVPVPASPRLPPQSTAGCPADAAFSTRAGCV